MPDRTLQLTTAYWKRLKKWAAAGPRETVTAALEDTSVGVSNRRSLSLFGTIEYEPGFDYKRERKAKRG